MTGDDSLEVQNSLAKIGAQHYRITLPRIGGDGEMIFEFKVFGVNFASIGTDILHACIRNADAFCVANDLDDTLDLDACLSSMPEYHYCRKVVYIDELPESAVKYLSRHFDEVLRVDSDYFVPSLKREMLGEGPLHKIFLDFSAYKRKWLA